MDHHGSTAQAFVASRVANQYWYVAGGRTAASNFQVLNVCELAHWPTFRTAVKISLGFLTQCGGGCWFP